MLLAEAGGRGNKRSGDRIHVNPRLEHRVHGGLEACELQIEGRVMDLPGYLQHADGEIRVTGHRIGLFHVVDRYQDGYSPEMIGEELAALPLALIHRVIAFYLENQHDVYVCVAAYPTEWHRQ